ncbi:MAG: hypothetical protein WEB52_07705 [Dehalococcoidia bacterium]
MSPNKPNVRSSLFVVWTAWFILGILVVVALATQGRSGSSASATQRFDRIAAAAAEAEYRATYHISGVAGPIGSLRLVYAQDRFGDLRADLI